MSTDVPLKNAFATVFFTSWYEALARDELGVLNASLNGPGGGPGENAPNASAIFALQAITEASRDSAEACKSLALVVWLASFAGWCGPFVLFWLVECCFLDRVYCRRWVREELPAELEVEMHREIDGVLHVNPAF